MVWSPCSPRDSQESSQAPQFESIYSLLLSLLYDPSLTSVLDYRINHSSAYTAKTLPDVFFVGKVMSLLFNMFSRFVIAFFPRSKGLLISWLPSPSTVIWEPKKIKSVKASTFSPSICNEVIGPEARILVFFFLDVEFQAIFFTLFFYPHQETL